LISPTALQAVLDGLITKGIAVATVDNAPGVVKLLTGLKAAIDFPGVCIGLAGVINMIPFINTLTTPAVDEKSSAVHVAPLVDLEPGDVPPWFTV
jgi:hypothetical protein